MQEPSSISTRILVSLSASTGRVLHLLSLSVHFVLCVTKSSLPSHRLPHFIYLTSETSVLTNKSRGRVSLSKFLLLWRPWSVHGGEAAPLFSAGVRFKCPTLFLCLYMCLFFSFFLPPACHWHCHLYLWPGRHFPLYLFFTSLANVTWDHDHWHHMHIENCPVTPFSLLPLLLIAWLTDRNRLLSTLLVTSCFTLVASCLRSVCLSVSLSLFLTFNTDHTWTQTAWSGLLATSPSPSFALTLVSSIIAGLPELSSHWLFSPLILLPFLLLGTGLLTSRSKYSGESQAQAAKTRKKATRTPRSKFYEKKWPLQIHVSSHSIFSLSLLFSSLSLSLSFNQ